MNYYEIISKLCDANLELSKRCIYRIQEFFGRYSVFKIIATTPQEINSQSKYFNTIDEAYEYALSLPDNYDFRMEHE